MTQPRPLLRIVSAIMTGALLVSACSTGADQGQERRAGTGSGPATEALRPYLEKPSAIPNWPPLTQRPPTGTKLFYIHTGSSVGQIISRSLERASAALRWEYRALTYNPANLSTANSAYLTAVGSDADIIISTGLRHEAIQQGLDAAAAKGVVVVQAQNDEEPGATKFHHVFNNKINAKVWAKAQALAYVSDAERTGTAAHVGVVTSSGIPVIRSGAQATVEAIEGNCDACTAKLIDIPVTQASNGQASAAVISFIQQNPDTNYVDVPGPWEGGLRAALDGAGLGQVQVGGLQPTPAQNTELAAGGSLFWVQLPFGYQAWVAVDAAVRGLTGGNASIHNEETGLLWVVNKDNLDFDTKTLPEFPAGFEEQFKKLWLLT